MKLIDLFFPPVCPICHGYAGKSVLCDLCSEKMNKLEAAGKRYISVDGKGVLAYYLYGYNDEDFKRYVFTLKRIANSAMFCDVAQRLLTLMPEELKTVGTVITGMPRTKSKTRRYGYDHGVRMAKALAKASGTEYKKLILRKGISKEQKELKWAERQENVRGKFRAVRKDGVSNIVLVDDVITTGSSFAECVRQLRSVYGNSVQVTGLFLASRNIGKTDDI